MQYLKRAEKLRIKPNFWMSKEYLEAAGAVEIVEDGFIRVEADVMNLFPILPVGSTRSKMDAYHYLKPEARRSYWAGFPIGDRAAGVDQGSYKFLDYNFIYKPSAVVACEGYGFKKFRKNAGKIGRRYSEVFYENVGRTVGIDMWEMVADLLLKWVRNRGADKVQDGDTIVQYVENAFGTERLQGLFVKDSCGKFKLIGLNAWDENWKYINYRYCITDPDVPYTDECLRYHFYIGAVPRGKCVNDGGSLDNPGLRAFKESLQPLKIHNVFTFER